MTGKPSFPPHALWIGIGLSLALWAAAAAASYEAWKNW